MISVVTPTFMLEPFELQTCYYGKKRLGHENIETILNMYSRLYPSKKTKLLEVIKKLGEISLLKNKKFSTLFWCTNAKKKPHKLLKIAAYEV